MSIEPSRQGPPGSKVPHGRGVDHLFHFRTIPLLLIAAAILGFIGGIIPFLMVVLGVGMILTALKCLVWPQRVGRGRMSIPIGHLDALVWLSVVPILVLIGLAVVQGHSPTYYLGTPG